MKANFDKDFTVDAGTPIENVWANFTTPDKVVVCLPGATLIEILDEKRFKSRIEVKLGPVKSAYEGVIEFTERNQSEYSMKMKGATKDVKGKGSADFTLSSTIHEQEEGVKVDISMEVNIQGMLAQFGARLINDATNQIFNQFIKNFKAQLAGEEVDNRVKAGAMMGGMIKGIFKKG